MSGVDAYTRPASSFRPTIHAASLTRQAIPDVWRKSLRSSSEGNCVEVADVQTAIAVRDSKDPDGPCLVVTRAHWGRLVGRAKRGVYDGG